MVRLRVIVRVWAKTHGSWSGLRLRVIVWG